MGFKDAKAKKKVVEEDAAELKEETKEAGGSPVSPPTLSTAINSFLDELSKSPTALGKRGIWQTWKAKLALSSAVILRTMCSSRGDVILGQEIS